MAFTAEDFASFLSSIHTDELIDARTVLEDMPSRQSIVLESTEGRVYMEGLVKSAYFRVLSRGDPDDKDGARKLAGKFEQTVLSADTPFITDEDDRVISMDVRRTVTPESSAPDNGRRWKFQATYRVDVNTDL